MVLDSRGVAQSFRGRCYPMPSLVESQRQCRESRTCSMFQWIHLVKRLPSGGWEVTQQSTNPHALHTNNVKSKMGTEFTPGGRTHLRKNRHRGTKVCGSSVWTSPGETWGCATGAPWCCWPRQGPSAPSASWPSPWAPTTGCIPEGCAAPRARTTTRLCARTRRCSPTRVCGGPAAPKVELSTESHGGSSAPQWCHNLFDQQKSKLTVAHERLYAWIRQKRFVYSKTE